MKLWKSAGLQTVVIGFEEINNEKLKTFHKINSQENNHRAIQILKEIGIRIIGDFIVSPDYTEKDFLSLENFVESSGIDVPIPSILTPLPGTPLFRKMKDRIVIHDLDYYTFTNAVVKTALDEKHFYNLYTSMIKRFLSHLN